MINVRQNLICSECGKKHSKFRITKFCCKKCQRDNFYKENKHRLLQKSLKREREKIRIKRGLPLDHPRLLKKAGEGHLDKRTGYQYLTKTNHPNAGKNGRILEHTLVMSEYLKRPLMKGETVHHINGIRNDNRIENLELWANYHHPGQRVKDKIKWCQEFLANYGYDVVKRE